MLEPAILPPSTLIENWSLISEMPIVETVPRAVPLSCFVRYPTETDFARLVITHTPLPASNHEKTLKRLSDSINQFNDYLSSIYPMRSLSAPLLEYRNKLSPQEDAAIFNSEQAQAIAKQFYDDIMQILVNEHEFAIDISQTFLTLFNDSSIWFDGNYSSKMLDYLSMIIYRFTAFEQLAPSKALITADISQFMKIAKSDSSNREASISIRSWIASIHAHTDLILSKLKEIEISKALQIFELFSNYLRTQIEAYDYTDPEQYYAYIVAYSFIINFYGIRMKAERDALAGQKRPKYQMKGLSNEVIEFTEKLIEKFTNLPMVFEFNIAFSDLILYKNVIAREKKTPSKQPPEINPLSMEQLLPAMRRNFTTITHLLEQSKAELLSRNTIGQKYLQLLPRLIHDIAASMNAIREKISSVLTHPPKAEGDDVNLSSFERSMRRGLKNSDLNTILLLLAICHNTKEQIEENLPSIIDFIDETIQGNVQEFIKTKLAATLIRATDDELKDIVEKIRVILGFFKSDSELIISEKAKVSKLVNESTGLKAPPNPGMYELLRVQLEFLVNPQSKFVNKPRALASVPLPEADQKEILQFLTQSRHYGELLQLQDTIDIACDQSFLYFKEFYLSQSVGNFFPVKCSLPFILTDFAMNHYQRSELTDAVFFPLSIYDDAASKALRFFKSQMMYDEIKAEASICIQSISQLISDKSFHPLRRFISYQSFPPSIMKQVSTLQSSILNESDESEDSDEETSSKNTANKNNEQETEGNNYSPISETSAALRLKIILQQNQLNVLGWIVDTKTLIADRMNVLMEQELEKIIKLTEQHGVLAAIAVTKLTDILQKEHDLLLHAGLPMLPFKDILSIAASTDSPNSLQSLLLFNYAQHLMDQCLNKFYLLTNPFRLIPKKHIKVDIGSLHVGKEFCDQMQIILAPTFSMITNESFREAFKHLGDGGVTILQRQFSIMFDDIWTNLDSIYQAVSSKLTRIQDFPLSNSSKEVYDRFEGAYGSFVNDQDIQMLFETMAQVGNLLAIVEMMDHSLLNQTLSEAQIASFLFSKSPLSQDNSRQDELFNAFDNQYQNSGQWFKNFQYDLNESNLVAPYTANLLRQFKERIGANASIYEETSQTLLDQKSLRGFAAMWSVLEFIFDLMETDKKDENGGSFRLYGSGVLLCAAAILVCTNQQDLWAVLSIGNRFSAHQLLQFSLSTDMKIEKFLDVHNFVSSIIECGISSYKPAIGD